MALTRDEVSVICRRLDELRQIFLRVHTAFMDAVAAGNYAAVASVLTRERRILAEQAELLQRLCTA